MALQIGAGNNEKATLKPANVKCCSLDRGTDHNAWSINYAHSDKLVTDQYWTYAEQSFLALKRIRG